MSTKRRVKPSSQVVAATAGATAGQVLASVATAAGWITPEIAVALPSLFALIGGMFHKAGRT